MTCRMTALIRRGDRQLSRASLTPTSLPLLIYGPDVGAVRERASVHRAR